jgi:hypothetical protein
MDALNDSGYTLSSDENNNGNCNQNCTNTHGSFSCSCRNGYRLSGEHDCEDINECLTDTELAMTSMNV